MTTTTQDAFNEALSSDLLLKEIQQTPFTGTFQRALEAIIGSIKKVVDSQLVRYVSGELSNVTPELLRATKSSAPHNVFAERVLGMYNALYENRKQATTSVLEAKVKLATNKVLDWLDSHPRPDQQKLVLFAVKQGAVMRREEQKRKEWLLSEVSARLVQASQKRDMKERNALTKKIASALKSGDDECLAGFEYWSKLEDDVKEKVRSIVKKEDLVGVQIGHAFDQEDGSVEYYKGQIMKQKEKRGVMNYDLKYWLPAFQTTFFEDEDSYQFTSSQLICDLFMGDLQFIV